jgi:hypothetical protein
MTSEWRTLPSYLFELSTGRKTSRCSPSRVLHGRADHLPSANFQQTPLHYQRRRTATISKGVQVWLAGPQNPPPARRLGFYRRRVSQSSKGASCSENVWLFQPRCGPKSSNYFTEDTRGSNAWSHSRVITRTGRVWFTKLKKLFACMGPAQQQQKTSRGNTALVASSNKTMGAHSHRLCWPTPG